MSWRPGRHGAVAVAVAIGCASASSAETAAVPSFAGRWKLNKELSDKPPAAPEAAKPAAEEKKDGVESPKPPDVAPSSSGEFTVRQSEVEIVAQEDSGQSRSFYPNGRTYKADDGTADIRSAWKSGALVFEKKSDRGWKYTETWRLTPEGRLQVDTRLSSKQRSAAARPIPGEKRNCSGTSTPRPAASSRSVASRKEPSRCRCRSARGGRRTGETYYEEPARRSRLRLPDATWWIRRAITARSLIGGPDDSRHRLTRPVRPAGPS